MDGWGGGRVRAVPKYTVSSRRVKCQTTVSCLRSHQARLPRHLGAPRLSPGCSGARPLVGAERPLRAPVAAGPPARPGPPACAAPRDESFPSGKGSLVAGGRARGQGDTRPGRRGRGGVEGCHPAPAARRGGLGVQVKGSPRKVTSAIVP